MAAKMSERELQTAVIEMARALGWRVAHFRPAQTAKGWRTPVEADGAGFPDLLMAHETNGMAVYAIELKADKGKLSDAQVQWLEALGIAGCYCDVWRPKDWTSGRIEELLRMRGDVFGGSPFVKAAA